MANRNAIVTKTDTESEAPYRNRVARRAANPGAEVGRRSVRRLLVLVRRSMPTSVYAAVRNHVTSPKATLSTSRVRRS